MQYFPDRFVRREINDLEVICPFANDGCNWEGKYGEYYNHISMCDYRPIEIPDIRVFATNVSPSQSLDLSGATSFEPVQLCSESLQCPLSALGCIERFMDKHQLNQHFHTHLSLFFVVMRGEFDNILQWPFTHKVTFKLINQVGGEDVLKVFQPDPLDCSFRKPSSGMNIASGCPQFISHIELERGGFIVDDTIFIKCMIGTSTIHHP